jgi:hypothetical protein
MRVGTYKCPPPGISFDDVWLRFFFMWGLFSSLKGPPFYCLMKRLVIPRYSHPKGWEIKWRRMKLWVSSHTKINHLCSIYSAHSSGLVVKSICVPASCCQRGKNEILPDLPLNIFQLCINQFPEFSFSTPVLFTWQKIHQILNTIK